MSDSKGLELVDVVNALREQLGSLSKSRTDSDIAFEVKDIELELSAKVGRKDGTTGSAGVKFWVVDTKVGGSRDDTTEEYQRIKLNLSPVFPKGKDPFINGTVAKPRGE